MSKTVQLKKLLIELQEMHQSLEIPDEIESKLAELEDFIADALKLLSILKIIPAIRSPLTVLINTIKTLERIARKQQDIVEKADDKVEPVREELGEFNERLDHVIDWIDRHPELKFNIDKEVSAVRKVTKAVAK